VTRVGIRAPPRFSHRRFLSDAPVPPLSKPQSWGDHPSFSFPLLSSGDCLHKIPLSRRIFPGLNGFSFSPSPPLDRRLTEKKYELVLLLPLFVSESIAPPPNDRNTSRLKREMVFFFFSTAFAATLSRTPLAPSAVRGVRHRARNTPFQSVYPRTVWPFSFLIFHGRSIGGTRLFPLLPPTFKIPVTQLFIDGAERGFPFSLLPLVEAQRFFSLPLPFSSNR